MNDRFSRAVTADRFGHVVIADITSSRLHHVVTDDITNGRVSCVLIAEVHINKI